MQAFLEILFLERLQCRSPQKLEFVLGLPIILIPLAQGKPLVASTIFTALSMIDVLTTCMKNLAYGLNSAADYYSVIKRAEEVFLLE